MRLWPMKKLLTCVICTNVFQGPYFKEIASFWLKWFFFLIFFENIILGTHNKSPRRGASNEYLQQMFSWTNKNEIITKTRLYNCYPLKPHFYIVKLGFTGVYVICLILAQKHRLWYSLEPPQMWYSLEPPRWGSVLSRSTCMKYIRDFYLKIFSFWR